MALDPVLALVLRAAFALLFGAAAVHKLLDLAQFRRVLDLYLRGLGMGGGPASRTLGPVVAIVTLAMELATAVACCTPSAGDVAALLAIVVLLAYALAMAVNIQRGNTILDCGCHWGTARQPVSLRLVARNGLLALAAAAMALPIAARELGAIDRISIAAGVLMAALMYGAANRLLNPDPSLGSTHS